MADGKTVDDDVQGEPITRFEVLADRVFLQIEIVAYVLLGGDELLRLSPQLRGVQGRIARQFTQRMEQLTIQIRPMGQDVIGVFRRPPPQICDSSAHYEQQPVGIAQQTVAQKIRYLDASARLARYAPGRWRPRGQAARVTAQRCVGDFAQTVVHVERIEQLDALQHLVDLAR